MSTTAEAPAHRPPQSDAVAVESDDRALVRAVPTIEARLHQRFPTAPELLIRSGIEDAVRLTAGARVRNYLPILIERHVADALRSRGHAPAERNGPDLR